MTLATIKCKLVFSYNPKPTLNIDKIQEAAKLINAKSHLYYLVRELFYEAESS
jgi:hypothetical protein